MPAIQSQDNTSNYSLFIKRVGLVGITRFIVSARGLVLLTILTKMLGAEAYGAWSIILVTIGLLMPFVMLGLPSSMVRFLPAEKERKNLQEGFFSILFTILFTGIIFALGLFFLSDSLATIFLKDVSFAPIIKIASLVVILQALDEANIESFRTFGQIRRYSIITILQTFLEIGLIWFLISSGFGLAGAVIALAISRGAIFLLSLGLIISHIGFSFPHFSVLRPYLAFGLPLVPSVIFEWLIASSDRYMIGFFMGAAPVGIYSAAYGIGTMAGVTVYIIVYVLGPTIFKSFDEGKVDEVKSYLAYSLKYFLLFAIPSVFGLSILAKPLLCTLTTPEFISPGIFIIPLVASSMIFEGMRAIYGEGVMLSKHTRIFAIASLVAGLTNIGLNIVFIPRFGVIGAAIATLISYIMVGFIMYYNSRKYIRFQAGWDFIIKSILASVVMTLAIWAFSPVGAVRIVLSIVIGAVVYFAMLFLLRGFKREELRVITKTLGLKRLYERL